MAQPYQAGNDTLIIRRKEYSLEDLLSQAKTENIYKEADSGKSEDTNQRWLFPQNHITPGKKSGACGLVFS
ncbi:hypothetical protein Dtox_0680 [Desulfofarcimen acetoxidans DSM 771]|uniref:Uncharacterized protein n=1 Tax=Desulfofarcimen acetoxidans (strain ATCC 49208 / DSM 771 / KCTC 5769 / VKM B-1644 / 5575) TaxID=485916 RepID=C8W1E9_DESAS|nr:hypothetical protein [Desulfofarcimen acetoxidans]ACV61594.1 hypothetical protein Dtox_0680 [Desulfofarcimen acetoxidans DSM 771]